MIEDEEAVVISRPSSEAKLWEMIPVELKTIISACSHSAEDPKISKTVVQQKTDFSLPELSLLKSVVTKRLSEYKTSLSQDLEILKKLKNDTDKAGSERYRMAVEVRKGEKEILHALLTSSEQYIADETRSIARESIKRRRGGEDMGPARKK